MGRAAFGFASALLVLALLTMAVGSTPVSAASSAAAAAAAGGGGSRSAAALNKALKARQHGRVRARKYAHAHTQGVLQQRQQQQQQQRAQEGGLLSAARTLSRAAVGGAVDDDSLVAALTHVDAPHPPPTPERVAEVKAAAADDAKAWKDQKETNAKTEAAEMKLETTTLAADLCTLFHTKTFARTHLKDGVLPVATAAPTVADMKAAFKAQSPPAFVSKFDDTARAVVLHVWSVRARNPALRTADRVCDALAVYKGVKRLTTDVSAFDRTELHMGVEEEAHNIKLAGVPGDWGHQPMVEAAAKVTVHPAQVPYLTLSEDKMKLTADGGNEPILEFGTAPLPIGMPSLGRHRAVVDALYATLPAGAPGATRTLAQVVTAFNNAVKHDDNTKDFQLNNPVADVAGVTAQRVVNTNPKITFNNIQVNFECSLCSIARSPAYATAAVAYPDAVGTRDLHLKAPMHKRLLLASRAAAETVVIDLAKQKGLYGTPELPVEQLCDLHGLFTVFYQHAFFWGVRSRVDQTDWLDLRNYQEEAHTALRAKNAQFWTAHYKNMFAVMVKTSVAQIMELLPFPASELVSALFADWKADATRAGIEKYLSDTFIKAAKPLFTVSATEKAVLTTAGVAEPENFMLKYLNKIAGTAHDWLRQDHGDGDWIGDMMPGLAQLPWEWQGAKPAKDSSPVAGRSPGAAFYRSGVDAPRRVVAVVEARTPTHPMNLAFGKSWANTKSPEYVASEEWIKILQTAALPPKA